jgi:hypothetical protein
VFTVGVEAAAVSGLASRVPRRGDDDAYPITVACRESANLVSRVLEEVREPWMNPVRAVARCAGRSKRDIARLCAKAKTPAAQALFDADCIGIGQWPPDESELGSLISAEVWAQMTNPAPELVGPVAIAVDRSPDRKQWAIAAAQRTTDGRIHLEIGPYDADSWSNTDLVEKLVHIVTEWDPIALAIDQRSAGAVLKPHLIGAEIEPHITNASELALACGGFLDDALAGRLSHSDQETLNEAVVAAVKRDMQGGGFAWAKTPGSSIANLTAATLAHWSLLTFGPAARPRVIAPPSLGSDRSRSREDDDFGRVLEAAVDIWRAPF